MLARVLNVVEENWRLGVANVMKMPTPTAHTYLCTLQIFIDRCEIQDKPFHDLLSGLGNSIEHNVWFIRSATLRLVTRASKVYALLSSLLDIYSKVVQLREWGCRARVAQSLQDMMASL